VKKILVSLLSCVAFALAIAQQGPGPAPKPLSSLMPPSAVLYLEAKDFKSLLNDWNDSQAKRLWLKSDNYEVFSRSRLFIKLQQAQGEFAAAAGFPPDMSFLDSVAGERSALAIYDIGHLHFLYITAMPSMGAMESVLWKAREKFETRQAAGITYFIHTDEANHRVVAFATTKDYLFVATREDLMAGALELYAGQGGPALASEKWFADASQAAAEPGDLRLALDLQALARSPHFRSYWIERNVSELKQYEAEIADVHRTAGEIREDRVLLRMNPPESAPTAPPGEDLGEILRFVPNDAGLYRAWENPSAEQVLGLLTQKILLPRPGPAPASKLAPSVTLGEGEAGAQGDFETRIDEAPVSSAGGKLQIEPLRKLFEASPPTAALQFESTRAAADSVLIGTESAVVLSASKDWDGDAARAAIQTAVAGLWSTSGLGAKWVRHEQGGKIYFELDGLNPLSIATSGHFLFIATRPEPLLEALACASAPAAAVTGVYAAGLRHAREREQLVKMLRLVETPAAMRLAAFSAPGGHEPLFFSENLASLSGALRQVESESIVVKDSGGRVDQTVRYKLSP
jgi:hypothetical protein